MERKDTYFFSLQLTWCSKSRPRKSRELEEADSAGGHSFSKALRGILWGCWALDDSQTKTDSSL